jgi:transcriptional regulator with XRE-family HTH domain
MSNTDIRWILDTLKTSLRLLEVTNREIENKMGWSHGYLSRIFAGNIELRMEHILEIIGILRLHPAEFFELAYPQLPDPPSEAAQRLRSLLRRYQAEPPPAVASPRPPEVAVDDRQLIDIVRKLVVELRRMEGAGPGA